jgi:hypothetical protein
VCQVICQLMGTVSVAWKSGLGTPRRRRCSATQKAAIVAESQAPDAQTSEIALRYGLHCNQLYSWRREFGTAAVANAIADAQGPDFVPVVADVGSGAAAIEIEIGSAIVRVRAGVGFGRTRQGAAPVEGDEMIPALSGTPPAGVRVLIATRPVDFRRGADGLAVTCNRCCGRTRSAGRSSCFARSGRTG